MIRWSARMEAQGSHTHRVDDGQIIDCRTSTDDLVTHLLRPLNSKPASHQLDGIYDLHGSSSAFDTPEALPKTPEWRRKPRHSRKKPVEQFQPVKGRR
jgi:hypothetical protein